MTIISIHIPETAGAVFGNLLQGYFGSKICLHYYYPYNGSMLRLEDIPADTECIHGHFLARRFMDRFSEPKLVTWLRSPAERVVSEYEHLKCNPDPNSGLSQLISQGASLLEFAEHDYARNTQTRYVDGVAPDQFLFIGIGERFDAELHRFSQIAGISLPKAPRINGRISISPQDRERILELNTDDRRLYENGGGSLMFEPAPPEAIPPVPHASQKGAHPLPGSSYAERYVAQVARLQSEMNEAAALAAAVGGDFLTVGKLEFALLRSLGLKDNATVVDVGCGSGRLALQLSAIPKISYIGTDVVPELLAYARKITDREDWRFELANSISIPCEDSRADFVCFFSVLTHLTHEDSYRYLREAKRVVKHGGKIVFSFFEFYIPWHWSIFERSVDYAQPGEPINQYIDREAIKAWAYHLGMKVVSFHDGDKPHIPINEELKWENGSVMKDTGNLGQSVAILEK